MLDQQRPLTIVWAAMLASLAIYAWIVVSVVPSRDVTVDPLGLRIVLSLLALSTLIALPVVRRFMLAPRADVPVGTDPAEAEKAVLGALGRVWSASIVSFAFAESIAMYGIVLAYISAEVVDFLPFFVVSVISMVRLRPTEELVLEALGAGGAAALRDGEGSP